jgi:hypothetical protein
MSFMPEESPDIFDISWPDRSCPDISMPGMDREFCWFWAQAMQVARNVAKKKARTELRIELSPLCFCQFYKHGRRDVVALCGIRLRR